jgi:hypothetical protein
VLTIEGQDGMRFLGADPRVPADEIERVVMLEHHRRIVKVRDRQYDEAKRAAK